MFSASILPRFDEWTNVIDQHNLHNSNKTMSLEPTPPWKEGDSRVVYLAEFESMPASLQFAHFNQQAATMRASFADMLAEVKASMLDKNQEVMKSLEDQAKRTQEVVSTQDLMAKQIGVLSAAEQAPVLSSKRPRDVPLGKTMFDMLTMSTQFVMTMPRSSRKKGRCRSLTSGKL